MTRLTGLALAAAISLPVATTAQTAPPNPLFEEPRAMDKAMTWVEEFAVTGAEEPYDGLYPDFGHMITGAGWISLGPGYRRHLFGGEAVMDVSAALSWRAYKIAQGRLEFPHLAEERLVFGAKALWQDLTQVRYFGLGADSRRADVSDYRLQASNLVGYMMWRPEPYLAVGATVGWLSRPGLSSSTGPFDRAEPDTTALHADDPGATLTRQPRYAHTELTIAADNRNHQSYPTDGGVVRFAWSTYRDRPAGLFGFDRYEGEAAFFRPLFGRSVLAARLWGVYSKTLEDRQVPFYLMPSLGGHNTLRGYADYRFHDRHLIVANLESRWALFEHIDTAVFMDAGNVAGRWSDLDLSRTSYGLGMRVHTERATLARFDVARSTEGWRVLVKVTDPVRLARFARRTAALPFVP